MISPSSVRNGAASTAGRPVSLLAWLPRAMVLLPSVRYSYATTVGTQLRWGGTGSVVNFSATARSTEKRRIRVETPGDFRGLIVARNFQGSGFPVLLMFECARA